MNINLKPGAVLPQDHVEYLVTRFGWRQVTFILLTYALRRKRLGLRRRAPAPLSRPPDSAYLRRDIGLRHDATEPFRYWELR